MPTFDCIPPHAHGAHFGIALTSAKKGEEVEILVHPACCPTERCTDCQKTIADLVAALRPLAALGDDMPAMEGRRVLYAVGTGRPITVSDVLRAREQVAAYEARR